MMGLPSIQPTDATGKLSKSEINDLPVRKWEGPVHLIDSDAQMVDAVLQLQNEHVIGFDVETRPAFKKGVSYRPSLVQMAGTNYVNIFQLTRLSEYTALIDLMSNPRILKVGVGLANDAQHLQSVFAFQPKKLLDLSEVTRKVGIESYGLRSLSAHFLGFRISKRAQCSNWDNKELRPFQISYAATDAWVSREIYLAMEQRGLLDALVA
ncbi:MAG: 3'-5' exonuclease domain-containing protein 2 [Magnetococcales bacterium]|nr:3'-5' exonuclease domain-containing protein 2 [Magnetococcales bacterium]